MNKEDESLITQIAKKYKFDQSLALSEAFVASIVYVSKLRPHIVKENPLSVREMVCMSLMTVTKNIHHCATLLNISPQTITTYEKRIRQKLGARNRTQALYIALRRGYLSLEK